MKHTISKTIIITLISTIISTAITFNSHAYNIKEDNYTDEQICNAIFLAEGGYNATFLYGIVSVSYETEAEAKRICINTIRNNRKRYADYGYKQYDSYLEFLASRYCPVEAHPLNKYWLKNVKWFLVNSKETK